MIRSATARWEGSLKQGQGRLTTASQALSAAPYSFPTRFENAPGTNPEELIAAAHAGCFAMALTYRLESNGTPPRLVETTADLTLEFDKSGPQVTKVHLRVAAHVPGLSADVFQRIALDAKEGCLVSRLLKTEITLDAVLAGVSGAA